MQGIIIKELSEFYVKRNFFLIKYSFHNLPFCVKKSKLMQGIAVKEISKFLVQHKSVFFIKYSLYNVPVRVNQSE